MQQHVSLYQHTAWFAQQKKNQGSEMEALPVNVPGRPEHSGLHQHLPQVAARLLRRCLLESSQIEIYLSHYRSEMTWNIVCNVSVYNIFRDAQVGLFGQELAKQGHVVGARSQCMPDANEISLRKKCSTFGWAAAHDTTTLDSNHYSRVGPAKRCSF